jgi:HPt (histidine-containing phosphotransfer) domain-containing protein
MYSNREQPAVVKRTTFDEDALRHRLSGDDELMAEVIEMFIDDLPARLVAINDAVTARDAGALRAAAHALKGSAGNLSVASLADAAHILERIGGESRMDAADAAWRRLSIDAGNVLDALRQYLSSDKEPIACAS